MKRGLLIFLVILLGLSACQFNYFQRNTPQSTATLQPEVGNQPATSTPASPDVEVTFRVAVPADTPESAQIYISFLDEVTGLALNANRLLMEAEPIQAGSPRIFRLSLSFPTGSIIKYRYERQDQAILVSEHTANGRPVRYRLYSAVAAGTLTDVVSRWTDTPFTLPNGRIIGQVTESETDKPLPNILICAGGSQTISAADGTFRIDGLPIGIHNLVAYALDGAYETFQQGAQIAAESTTPTPLKMKKARQVQVTFEVKVPADTPPIVPVRLAGNLFQLGNSFASLRGGMSSLVANMPVLKPGSDGRYTTTLTLPVGADIRYKYTLGDGFWNAEQSSAGNFKLRQFIVTENPPLIQDEIDTWRTAKSASLTFDVTTPVNTPAEDVISLQLNPLFGWTEPIPMWKLSDNHWGYILYSPLNLPGNLSYRYCRNSMCGSADDVATPGEYGKGRRINLQDLPLSLKDEVTQWVNFNPEQIPVALPSVPVNPRSPDFLMAVALDTRYSPSATGRFPHAVDQVKQLGANMLIFTPGWTYTQSNPPVIEPVPGKNQLWNELIDNITLASQQNLKIALFPGPEFIFSTACQQVNCPEATVRWWQESQHDFSWWQVWFEQYRKFALHFAELASQSGTSDLILGGDWILPALPAGKIGDGSFSNVPGDAEKRWQAILNEVRLRFTGRLSWAVTPQSIQDLPDFVNSVDQIYLVWEGPLGSPEATPEEIERQTIHLLDYVVHPLQYQLNKPLVVAVTLPATPDIDQQLKDYGLILRLVNERPWISGLVSQGYSPWALLQDNSASIYGKPTNALLQSWFAAWSPGETR